MFVVKIVECNPFYEMAGSCLFEWHNANDRAILLGTSPFEFRIVAEANKHVMKVLEEQWAKFVYPEKFITSK